MYAYSPAASSVLQINAKRSELFVINRLQVPNLKKNKVTHIFLPEDVFGVDIPKDLARFLANRLFAILSIKQSAGQDEGILLTIKFNGIFSPRHIPHAYLEQREFFTYVPLINFGKVHIGSGNLISVVDELLSMRSPFTLINILSSRNQTTGDDTVTEGT